MFHVYSDRALRRLGASLIQSEQPESSVAAQALLHDRLGAYVSGSQLIKDVVKRFYQSSSSSS